MNRLVMVSGSVLALAFVVAAQEGCSSSDSSGGGTSTPTAGAANSSAGASNTSTGGAGTAGAATGTAGAQSTAGAANGGGGAPAGGAPAGGAATAGGAPAGGAATAGGAPAGGATTAGGAGGATTMPTTACTTEKKGDACVAGAACAKTCGVKGQGATKSETCGPASTLVEGMCIYPAGAYTCYTKPATAVACAGADATTTAVTSGAACTAADCMPCGPYADSSGLVKAGGLCTCTGGKWTCASATEWPPQM
jgi:hypothetical protein